METIGSYKILGQLGTGGMGTVYLAEHRFLKRKSAVKVLLGDLVNRPDLLERFFAEARATSQLEHPGIVRIFDCEVDATGPRMRPYFVMELIEGDTLSAYQRRVGRVPIGEAVSYARAIADALGAAHERGIVHRDLKPDNVFVRPGPPPSVKLVDFGIAKLAGEFRAASVAKTQTGMIMGTPPYMSPEQCRGVGVIDHRTDIYALGCVLFEMLCGVTPFVRDSTGGFLVAHITQVPPSARSINASIPVGLSDLIAAMLAKAPEERPGSMREVVDRLTPFVPSGVGLAGQVTVKQVVEASSRPTPAGDVPVGRGPAPGSGRIAGAAPGAADAVPATVAAGASAAAPLAGLVTPVGAPPAMHTTLRSTAGELAADTSAALAEVVSTSLRRTQRVVAGAGALALVAVAAVWALARQAPPVEPAAPLPAIAAAGLIAGAAEPRPAAPASEPPRAGNKPVAAVTPRAGAPNSTTRLDASPSALPGAASAAVRPGAAAVKAPAAGPSTAASAAPGAPPPSSVVVELQSNPTGAAICFDGDRRLITVTHGAVQLPYDPRPVTFVLYLPGYEPALVTVRSNRNSKRTVTLRPSPPGVVRPPACDY